MLIKDHQILTKRCRELAELGYVAIDTEFIRENTYRAQLCLIQLCGPGYKPIAIDVLIDDVDLSPVFDLLDNPNLIKVFHSCRQDIEILYGITGKVPEPIFDTQVAAMVCGFGDSVGFGTLVSKITGIRVDKSPQSSDWALRPLTDRQINYALEDVRHLCTIYERLRDQLNNTGRMGWLSEEMAFLEDSATYKVDPREAWRRVSHKHAGRRTLAVLRELAAWREETASNQNVPRSYIMRDDSLLEIAFSTPDSYEKLARTRGLSDRAIKGRIGQQILSAIRCGLAVPDDQCPLLSPTISRSGNTVEMVSLLQALLKARSEEHAVAPRLIATRPDLERLATDSKAKIRALKGWRWRLFGEDAVALKHGRIALTGGSGGIKVVPVGSHSATEQI